MGEERAASEDATLVVRLRETGDARAFDRLYRRHRRAVFAVCLHYLKEPALAEDACHDAFVQAWQQASSLRGSAFLPWIRRIAANLCLNRLRHLAVARRIEPELEAQREHPRAVSRRRVIAREELERCVRIVRQMAPAQRRVFLLRHLEGLKPREIIERTGLSAGAVRSHLQNARRNFRLAWERIEAAQEGESP